MQLMAQTFKAFNATKNSSAHTEHDPVIEVKEEVMDLENPTLKRGHEIYVKLGQCITCHGEQGEGKKEMQAPLLAGQAEWYTASQLAAFKNGTRKNDAMVAQLHLKKIGVELDTLTQLQADYIGVPVKGPFKNDQYRY